MNNIPLVICPECGRSTRACDPFCRFCGADLTTYNLQPETLSPERERRRPASSAPKQEPDAEDTFFDSGEISWGRYSSDSPDMQRYRAGGERLLPIGAGLPPEKSGQLFEEAERVDNPLVNAMMEQDASYTGGLGSPYRPDSTGGIGRTGGLGTTGGLSPTAPGTSGRMAASVHPGTTGGVKLGQANATGGWLGGQQRPGSTGGVALGTQGPASTGGVAVTRQDPFSTGSFTFDERDPFATGAFDPKHGFTDVAPQPIVHPLDEHEPLQSDYDEIDRRHRRRVVFASAAGVLAVAAIGVCVWLFVANPFGGQTDGRQGVVATENLSGWITDADGTERFYDPATHVPFTGWVERNGGYTYVRDGEIQVGWIEDAGKYYWLDDSEGELRGMMWNDMWLEQAGKRYHLSMDGSADTGWVEVDGKLYCFGADGSVQTGWVVGEDGKTRWIKPEDGTLASHEWIEIDGVYQAFDDDGSWVTLGAVLPEGDASNVANMTDAQNAVVESCDSTEWPGAGLCAQWVSSVFTNAGLSSPDGNADDMARAWCTSTDLNDLKPGMIVAVQSHGRTESGSEYGHVGIYVGGGIVRDSGTYGVRRCALGSWLAWFGDQDDPAWGWAAGNDLSA